MIASVQCVCLPCSEACSDKSQEGEEPEVPEAGNQAHSHADPTPNQTPVPAIHMTGIVRF